MFDDLTENQVKVLKAVFASFDDGDPAHDLYYVNGLKNESPHNVYDDLQKGLKKRLQSKDENEEA